MKLIPYYKIVVSNLFTVTSEHLDCDITIESSTKNESSMLEATVWNLPDATLKAVLQSNYVGSQVFLGWKGNGATTSFLSFFGSAYNFYKEQSGADTGLGMYGIGLTSRLNNLQLKKVYPKESYTDVSQVFADMLASVNVPNSVSETGVALSSDFVAAESISSSIERLIETYIPDYRYFEYGALVVLGKEGEGQTVQVALTAESGLLEIKKKRKRGSTDVPVSTTPELTEEGFKPSEDVDYTQSDITDESDVVCLLEPRIDVGVILSIEGSQYQVTKVKHEIPAFTTTCEVFPI